MANILGRVGDAAKRYGRALTGSDTRKLQNATKKEMEEYSKMYSKMYPEFKASQEALNNKIMQFNTDIDKLKDPKFTNFENLDERRKLLEDLFRRKNDIQKERKKFESGAFAQFKEKGNRVDELIDATYKAKNDSLKARFGTLIGAEIAVPIVFKDQYNKVKDSVDKKQRQFQKQSYKLGAKVEDRINKNLNYNQKEASEILDDIYIEKIASQSIAPMPNSVNKDINKLFGKALLASIGVNAALKAAPPVLDFAIKGNDGKNDKKHFIRRLSDMPKTSNKEKLKQQEYLDTLKSDDIRKIKKRAKRRAEDYYKFGDNIKDFTLTAIPTLALLNKGFNSIATKGVNKNTIKSFKLAPVPAFAGTALINTKQRRADAAGLRDAINEYRQNQDYNKTASEYLNDLYIEKISSITYD